MRAIPSITICKSNRHQRYWIKNWTPVCQQKLLSFGCAVILAEHLFHSVSWCQAKSECTDPMFQQLLYLYSHCKKVDLYLMALKSLSSAGTFLKERLIWNLFSPNPFGCPFPHLLQRERLRRGQYEAQFVCWITLSTCFLPFIFINTVQ